MEQQAQSCCEIYIEGRDDLTPRNEWEIESAEENRNTFSSSFSKDGGLQGDGCNPTRIQGMYLN